MYIISQFTFVLFPRIFIDLEQFFCNYFTLLRGDVVLKSIGRYDCFVLRREFAIRQVFLSLSKPGKVTAQVSYNNLACSSRTGEYWPLVV